MSVYLIKEILQRLIRVETKIEGLATKEDFGRLDAEMKTLKWSIPLLTGVGMVMIALLFRFFTSWFCLTDFPPRFKIKFTTP